MGQIQNKYHVTNDGKIFSVLSDGSVKEIGNVSRLSQPVVVEKEVEVEVRKPGAWKWIAISAIVLLIASSLFFFINKEDSDRYIRVLNERINYLEGNVVVEETQVVEYYPEQSAAADEYNYEYPYEAAEEVYAADSVYYN